MHFAICEDSPAQAAEICTYLEEVPGSQISVFDHGQAFLDAVIAGTKFDIILLDIELPDMLGTAIAKALKDYLPHADVAFVSAYPQYVTEAFALRVSQFFQKPLNRHIFMHEIQRIMRIRATESQFWCVRNKKCIYRLHPSDIVYVEAYHRHLMIQTVQERIEITGKMSDAVKELEQYGFCLCHQGYLVNMKFVASIGKDEVTCTTGHKVLLSVRKKSTFLKAYNHFLSQ